MKKVMLIVLLACFGTCIAQNTATKTEKTPKAEKNTVKKTKAPQIHFDALEHDYGTIFEEDNGTCEFSFKNTGKEPLVLQNVYSSCGCTVPSWPKEPIMPGKSSAITVKYNTSRIGKINKMITVISNAENTPRVELFIKGEVKPKASASFPEKENNPLQVQPKH